MTNSGGPAREDADETRELPQMSKFSIRRYSTQQLILIFLILSLLTSTNVYAVMTGNGPLTALAGLTLTLAVIKTGIVLYAGFRTIGVEIWIRRMGMGDLDYRIEPRGRDEISLACEALETLRQSSIRAIELDLVRRLSNELQERNDQLEKIMADLRSAQDRIISQQKLAELGELTAGVAHEIRNPLNLIQNFARTSGGMLEELQETMTELDGAPSAEQEENIRELNAELTENMQRICQHSDRAERIIQDMMATGRTSAGRFQPTDVNELLERQTILAHQGACARNPGFSADLNWDLDPDLGEVSAVPEDLARMFANLATNACHALVDRARVREPDYRPALAATTRLDGDTAAIIIRDNGIGMTPEVLEKIFNPFFTAREANPGTGLGLSLCHDVLREHGGTIRAESEPGKWTELRVTLPLEHPGEG